MEIGIVRVEDTAAGAPATIPEGHLEYHKDTDKLYKSDGSTKVELSSGGAFLTEDAQDAVGAMIDTSLTYVDATPLLKVTEMTGDVTSTGANVVTIGNDKVTYAKMQNIATDRLLGRDTAGSGDVEELTVSNGIEFTGSTGIQASTRTLSTITTAVTINNTAAETTIFSYTIPANTVGSDGRLTLDILSTFLNNSGANRGWRMRVKLGGSTVLDFETGNNSGTSAAYRGNHTIINLFELGATNSQIMTLEYFQANASSTFGTVHTGQGASASTAANHLSINSGAIAQDMTASAVLEVTIELSTNLATLEWKTNGGSLSLMKP